MSRNETAAPVVPTRRQASAVALRGLEIVVGTAFIAIAAAKLLGVERFVWIYDEIGLGQWLRYAVAGIELTGGIGVLGVVFPRLSGPAALGLSGVMVGAVTTQLIVFGPTGYLFIPISLGILLLLVAWGRRAQIRWALGQLRELALSPNRKDQHE